MTGEFVDGLTLDADSPFCHLLLIFHRGKSYMLHSDADRLFVQLTLYEGQVLSVASTDLIYQVPLPVS
jgi:hypothetical protein